MSDIRSLNGDAIEQIAALAEMASEAPKHDIVEVFPAGGVADVPHGLAGILVPKTHDFKDLSKELDERIERLALGPRRLVARESAETLEGFIALTVRHGGANTAIEALLRPSPTFKTYVDYHVQSGGQGPEARRLEHSIAYAFPFSAKLQAWLEGSKGWKSKREFLSFVQERVADLASPYEVDAPEGSVTRTEFEGVLRARGKSKEERKAAKLEALFGTPEQLCDGARALGAISAEEFDEIESGLGDVSISYKKSDKTTGSEKVREFYLVDIPVFEGENSQVLPARLRTSVNNGALFLRLEALGLQTVIEKSFATACERVAKETGRPVYRVKLA